MRKYSMYTQHDMQVQGSACRALDTYPEDLDLPTASISSMNKIQGAFSRASSNNPLTLAEPCPTHTST